MWIGLALLSAALFVAYANGANDNFKGVATLYGSGTVGYRGALGWATLATAAGSLGSVLLAETLVKAFSGKGLVPDVVAAQPEFLTAVALGGALTVFLAALTGFPISSTHALTGGLVGAGLVAAGSAMNFGRLGGSFFLPLAVSPLLAVALGSASYPALRSARVLAGARRDWCVCVTGGAALVPLAAHGSTVIPGGNPVGLVSNEPKACELHRGPSLVLRSEPLVNFVHFLSSGAVSFARGLNDTPKIVGLLMVLEALQIEIHLIAVAVVMALGGILHARKVAETVSKRITPMSPGQGLFANLVTSGLVLTASGSGLPVSTTHVSCGSIFGMGLATGHPDGRVIRQILFSWVLTVPVAAVLSAAFAALLV